MRSTVVAGRVPMAPALRAMVLALIGPAVVAAAWAGVYAWRYMLLARLRGGDYSGHHDFLLTDHVVRGVFFLQAIASLLVGAKTRQWKRAGHANALTRPEVGLRWPRVLAKARTLMVWQWCAVGAWAAMLGTLQLTRFSSRTDLAADLQHVALAEIALAIVFIGITVGEIRAAKAATVELEATLDRWPGEVGQARGSGAGEAVAEDEFAR